MYKRYCMHDDVGSVYVPDPIAAARADADPPPGAADLAPSSSIKPLTERDARGSAPSSCFLLDVIIF